MEDRPPCHGKPLSIYTGETRCILSGTVSLFLVLFLYCLLIPKASGFLAINNFHSGFFDFFFILFTNVGNGLFVVGLLIFLVIGKKRWPGQIQIGIGFFVFRNSCSSDQTRISQSPPTGILPFQQCAPVLQFDLFGHDQFSIRTYCYYFYTHWPTLLAFYFPDRRSGLFLFFTALLTGYSRIYLSQHCFPVDVLAGSLIGVLTAIIIFELFPLERFEKKYADAGLDPQSAKLQ